MLGNKKKLLVFLSAFFIFLISAIYLTYPLIFHLTNFTTGYGDEFLIAWIQNHTIYSLFHSPTQLFNGNIFYPFSNTMAYSDIFLSSSILSAPLIIIFKEPIVAVNFTLISSLIMLGFSIFLLAYYLKKNYLASLIAGLMVVFSPAVLDKKVHLQILSVFWVPLSILFFLHFFKTKKSRWLALSMIFFVIQTSNSFLPGYFLIFFFLIYVIFTFFKKRENIALLFQKKNLFILLISLLVLLPLVIPYFKVSKEFNYTRDIRDSIHFALQPEDFLVTSSDSRMQNILPQGFRVDKFHNGEIKPGFLGLVFSILSIASLIYFIKKRKKDLTLISLFVTGILGLVTSLGPAMHLARQTIHHPFLIPLPYALFYYILPGFSGFRNSARWEVLFILCFAPLIAVMLAALFKKIGKEKSLIVSFFIILGIVLEFNYPLNFYNVPQISKFPEVYSFLKENPKPAIFIPVCNWNDKCGSEEFLRVYYSDQGFPQMVNGTSGFSPPAWQNEIQTINNNFPSSLSLNLIKQTGAKYIIFEKSTWDKYFKFDPLPSLESNKNLKLIRKFDNTYVFEL